LSSGITGAAPIYHDIMVELLKMNPSKYNVDEKFARPAGIVEAKVDALSGMKPGPYTTSTRTDVFAKWQVPTQEDDMHVKVRICKPSGLLASEECEDSGQAIDKIFVVLYDPYTKLFQTNYKKCGPCPPTAFDTNTSSDKPEVDITEPNNNEHVVGFFQVKADVNAISGTSITTVKFYIDGDEKAADTSSPYSATLNAALLSNGNHTLTVKAFSDDGKVGEDSITIKK
jgi:hypothetical protein